MAILTSPRQLSLGLREAAEHQFLGVFEALASIIDIKAETYERVFETLLEHKELRSVLRRITVNRIIDEWRLQFAGETLFFPAKKLVLTPCVRGISERGIEIGIPIYIPNAQALQTEIIIKRILGKEQKKLWCVHGELRLLIALEVALPAQETTR